MTLPNEIWLNVAQFLALDGELDRLYKVNSLFLDLALSQRYRELDLSVLEAGHLFKRLRDPFVARRVEAVFFAPRLSLPVEKPQPRPHVRRLSRMVNKLIHNPRPPVQSGPSLGQQIHDIIPHLTAVTELSVLWMAQAEPIPYALSSESTGYLARSWQTWGPNLQKLALNISLTTLGYIFQRGVPSLAQLKALELTIDGPSDNQSRKLLISFMNGLSDLRRLTVEANIDLSPIFEGLQHFPGLHAISLTLPDKENLREPSHLLRFLNLHRENITSAYFVGHISLPTPLLSELDFPYCHALEIDPGLLLDEWVTPVGLGRMRALTELSLLCPMTHPQLTAFLYCCASLTSAGTLNLQRLNLCPVDFSAALLDVLSRSLPRLRYLSLEIINVVDEKLVYVTPTSYFPLKSEMGTPSSHDKSRIDYEFRLLSVLDPFREWSLYDINITRHPYHCWGLMNLIAECVPSIKSFAGRDHKDMPMEVRKWMS